MITELRAQNFKSWVDTGALHLAPLTGFFGANSSGKSSILQILLLLKQTAELPPHRNEPLYFGDQASLTDLMSYGNVVHQPLDGRSLEFSVSWTLPQKMTILNTYELDTLSFFFNFYNWSVGRIRYQTNQHVFETVPDGPNHWVTIRGGREPVQSLFRCYGIRGASTRTEFIFSNLEKAFEGLFSRIHYLGPVREYPTPNSGQIRLPSSDDQIALWLQQLDLIHSYSFRPVNETQLKFPFVRKVEERHEFHVTQYKGGPEVRLKDVGFGVSQVLPVLSHCHYAREGDVLIIEHPEAHLHPQAQSELADVLIDAVRHRNVQIILESHSENLLLRLMRRIAEEKIPMEHTALYSCQINNGTSEIQPLIIDKYGNISNWPQNFFGDEMGDLAAKAKAEIERRKANKQWR